MPIEIIKQDGDIKFYGSGCEPIVIIYNGECSALLSYASIEDSRKASQISDAVRLAGLFVDSISIKNSQHFSTNNIEAVYLNESDLSTEERLYSAKKILNWIESDKVITVNKRKRIRRKFTKFTYKNDKLVILYKPVAW